MSYDINFKVKVAGTDKYVDVGKCEANITWNVRKIIELSTGLPWLNEENNGYCKDVIPSIEKGLKRLKNYPEMYRKHEAPNGWGTVDGVIGFFETIVRDWNWYKMCVDEEVADVTTFWVE